MKQENKPVDSACAQKIKAIHDTMDVLSGKWKVSIIACLCFKPRRFSDLLRDVEGISGKMLSRELRDLEMNQLVKRNVLDTQPVTVSYEITSYGATFHELTDVIAQWGLKHRKRLINGEL